VFEVFIKKILRIKYDCKFSMTTFKTLSNSEMYFYLGIRVNGLKCGGGKGILHLLSLR